MKSYTAALSLAGLISSVAAHGYISSPAPRLPGPAMEKACGQQMFNNQNSDHFGNIQGSLQVTNGQSDFDAASCNVWLCKGTTLEDNTANVQSYTAGQVVPIQVEIRAPHTGTANVSIVKTSSNTIIGQPLISFASYASNSAPIPANQTSFDITIPTTLGSECATAGDCVIQWYWDARSIDQTYEACIDFTVGGSGSAPAPAPSSSGAPAVSATPAPSSTPAPTSAPAPVVSAAPSATSVAAEATAAPTPAPSAGAGAGKEYTLETFIAFLEEKAAAAQAKKMRRGRMHARAF